ncbi:LysR family transcriptional regulator [Alteromonas sp. KUL42]|uniref:LysR family transcriptional regulator n=1 Tax=Alteromonas sp. KUL42 TaxID=2480797 RepID=UPI000795AFC7|nr:LysR family transcriptional regulator [Alteromonas sp. KUL42]KXJ60823.1 MAG: hypothetical protein AXW14_03490 [Alteromonas sp. Nap_26]GEA06552.1 LysR family transcriptional regulator [Alteromonas sp. KUL42]
MALPNDKHYLLRTFCAVADAKSFSKAAVILRMPVSSVSKNVKQLEDSLNTKLIIRNTRSMSLTEVGAIYYQKGRSILQALDDLNKEVYSLIDKIDGTLRISMPLMIGERVLSPVLSKFMKCYPDIALELDFSHSPTDLIEQDFDIAFRTASQIPDSSLFEKRLFKLQPIFVASPDYLNINGTPTSKADLVRHDRLVFRSTLETKSTDSFLDGESKNRNRVISNSHQSLISAAQSGAGIACVYDVLVEQELTNKVLVHILKDHQPRQKYLSMLYRQRGSTSMKIRTFIDFIQHYYETSTQSL